MNLLLLSMPDSFEHMPSVGIRMPNGALTSLAGNLDSHHRVAVADLILTQGSVRRTVERLVGEVQPDVVGLSVMTFQRPTAARIVRLVRGLRPEARIVVGGYDPSLAPEAYTDAPDAGPDFLVRGEGEITLRELLRAIETGSGFDSIAGLGHRSGGRFVHNPPRPIHSLQDGEIRLPNRGARVLSGYTLLGKPVDVVETSRGCTFDCSFCSIIAMRGRNFHTYDFGRVIEDIGDARRHGARVVFLVDDNITLDVARFEALCRAIVEAKLDTIDYVVQAMTSSIANHGERLAPLMRRAGFRYVFLGIENVLEDDLKFLRAASKNEERRNGRIVGNATLASIDHLHRNGMYVVGGLIVGNPGDTRASVEANLEFARRYVDWPYIQHPTPYPGTPMARDFVERGLLVHDRVAEYDGTTAVVRSEHLEAEEIEFLRWRAERWMKLRHVPAAFRQSPLWVLRNGRRMLVHTFRGSTLRSLLGLEDARAVFARYRAIRSRERDYLEDEEAEPPPARRLRGPMRTAVAWLLLAPALSSIQPAAPPAGKPLDSAFRRMYELDFDGARREIAAYRRAHPEDPLGAAAEAASHLFEEFDRKGVLTSEFFLDDDRLLGGVAGAPDSERSARFTSANGRARAMAEARLKKDPVDASALFALTLADGMEGDFEALIRKRQLAGLRWIRRAERTATRLLAVAPDASDATMALGAANYIIGCLPGYKRMFLWLGGVRGDRERGMQQLALAAEKGHYLRPLARALLALAARRERQPERARKLLESLSREFPRNPVFARELALVQP